MNSLCLCWYQRIGELKQQVSKPVPQSENCSLLCLCQGHIAVKSNFFLLLAESRNYIKMQMKIVEKKNLEKHPTLLMLQSKYDAA